MFFWKHSLRWGRGCKSFIWEKFPGKKSEEVGRETGKGENPVRGTCNGLVSIVDKYRAQSHWGPSKTAWLAWFRIVPPEAREAGNFIYWLLHHWLRVASSGIIFSVLLSWHYVGVDQPLLPWRKKALSSKAERLRVQA